MNVKIAIISGLIMACATVLRAEEDPQNEQRLYNALIPAVPVIYENADSTNVAFFLTPADPFFSASTEESSQADELEPFSESDAYPVLFLSEEEAMVFADAEWEEPGVIQAAEGETAFPGNAAESELRYWLEESFSPANEAAAGVGNSNFVQVIFIEPPQTPGADVSDDILIPEYEYQIVHAPPEWHEWLHPRMFISKWAEFWTTGPYSTNVVLVLIKF